MRLSRDAEAVTLCLDRCDIDASVRGDRLVLEGAPAVLTDDVIAAAQQCRSELIGLLNAEGWIVSVVKHRPEPRQTVAVM